MIKLLLRKFSIVFFLLLLPGCATYYQKNIEFQKHFVKGEIQQAAKVLEKNKDIAKGKNRLLYFLQKGVVLQMLGNYEESNQPFENAYLFSEDIQTNYGLEAFSLLSNPTVKPYRGEDFELVQIHYYKALNYLLLRQFENALVECRRIDIKLNQLNDKYTNRKNRYKRDAFAMNLVGIIYETAGEYNNAFIAYRNAYEIYKEDYKRFFGVAVPVQLKKDLLKTAYLNGFTEELKKYEREFGFEYEHQVKEGGELVLFWHNGLGPVKDEWSINFFIVKGKGGLVTFESEELGFSFPFFLQDDEKTDALGDLKFIRVAFPKYLEREPFFRSAELVVSEKRYSLELAQNINEIAFKTLEDRMLREFAKSLLRLALKQVAEQAVRRKNQDLGALLSIANTISEKADTRNWQTLPYSIYYVRIPLPEGENSVKLEIYSPIKRTEKSVNFQFNVGKGETLFHIYHSLESFPLEN